MFLILVWVFLHPAKLLNWHQFRSFFWLLDFVLFCFGRFLRIFCIDNHLQSMGCFISFWSVFLFFLLRQLDLLLLGWIRVMRTSIRDLYQILEETRSVFHHYDVSILQMNHIDFSWLPSFLTWWEFITLMNIG